MNALEQISFTEAREDLRTLALRHLASSLRYQERWTLTAIIAAFGWGCALPLMVWWLFFRGAPCQ